MTASRLVVGALLVVATTVFVLPLLAPVTGHTIAVVDGGSMRPVYQPGDLVVTAPVGAAPEVGDVVLVAGMDGGYVHRVVASQDGLLQLQGDANPVPDPGRVSVAQLSGVVVAHVGEPWGPVLASATSVTGRIAVVAVALACIVLLRRSSPRGHARASSASPSRMRS